MMVRRTMSKARLWIEQVRKYGKTQKEEGKIIEYISIRKEDGWKKKEILTKLVDRFGMNKSEAKRYYKEVCG